MEYTYGMVYDICPRVCLDLLWSFITVLFRLKYNYIFHWALGQSCDWRLSQYHWKVTEMNVKYISYCWTVPYNYSRVHRYSHFHSRSELTHPPLDKMAAILADDNFRYIFMMENDRIPIRIRLKFIPRSPIDNTTALVQVMAWRRTGDKPLPEPSLTQITDAYMRH